MSIFRNVSKRIFVLLVATAVLFGVLQGASAFAEGDNYSEPRSQNSGLGDDEGFMPGEVVALADSGEHALTIAAAYGLELKSYAYGIAVLSAPDPEEAVAQSMAATSTATRRDGEPLPQLSLNRLYQICEAGYKLGETTNKIGGPAYGYRDFAPPRPYEYNANGNTAAELAGAPEINKQWHHGFMCNEQAWELSYGKNVVVAVIDTGIDIDHPDFAGRIISKSYNSHTNQTGTAYVRDDYGHGTHVSGILAGMINDTAGLCGVAPQAEIMTIKANIPAAPGYFEQSSLLRGVNYAVENGAQVINMSLGRPYGSGADQLERTVIANAVMNGVTVICAAGNYNPGYVSYPAAYPETIAVSAIRWDGLFDISYSNYGPEVDIAAPGTSIYSTVRGGGYDYNSGTSMASPCVSGAAALVLSQHPEYTPDQVRNALCQTARDTGELGKDIFYGYGIVNSFAALLSPDELLTVTFDYNDGSRAPVIAKVAPGGKLLTTHAPMRDGYAFSGWYITGTADKFDFAEAIYQDMSLNALWASPAAGMYITEFPDQVLRREVLRMLNGDGSLRTEGSLIDAADLIALASFTYLDVADMLISDMTGLSYLSGLETLWCNDNQLTSLDVSKNTKLVQLICWNNQLTGLDISNNPLLKILCCDENRLYALDVSNNPLLEVVSCATNQVAALNVSQNSALKELNCSENRLSMLNVSQNTLLEVLWCYGNDLSELDVSNNPLMRLLSCFNGQLTTLDLSNNNELALADCRLNYLTSPDDVTGWREAGLFLGDTFLFHPQKTDIELSAYEYAFPDANFRGEVLRMLNTDGENRSDKSIMSWDDVLALALLPELYVSRMSIQDMTGLSYLSGLISLWCSFNQLTELDVSNNTALEYLSCWDNQLSVLDVSHNPALWYLDCDDNQLSSLDLTSNAALAIVHCDYNRLNTLLVSPNITLRYISCYSNQLTALDVSENTSLVRLDCRLNYLRSLEDIIGWQALGLVLNDSLEFYPQGDIPLIPVTDISGVPTQATAGRPLTLTGTVLPTDATNQAITWSVKEAGNTGAVIAGNTLTASAAGTVTATIIIKDGLGEGIDYLKEFIITVHGAVLEDHSFRAYLRTPQTYYSPGDTIYVDLMLVGELKYAMVESKTAYDTGLLEYLGYENLSCWLGQVYREDQNLITMRNVPNINMNVGVSCITPVRLITLKFKVKDILPAYEVTTDLSFAAINVYPTSDTSEATTTLGEPLTITLHK